MGCRLPRSENSRRQSSGVVTDQSASPGGLRLRKRQSANSPVGEYLPLPEPAKGTVHALAGKWHVSSFCDILRRFF